MCLCAVSGSFAGERKPAALRLAQCSVPGKIMPSRNRPMGTNMRGIALLKFATLAGALTLIAAFPDSSFAARTLPAGSCVFHRHAVANGGFCSYACNPASGWCSQQLCTNGVLHQVISCYGSFCSAKCG